MDRRNFLRHIAGAVGAAPFTLAAKDPRPNIVLMMADDMGFSDIGCYGSEIATPNLDQLGRNGLRFTQFYNMARCCPTRAALLTGLYPHEAGVGHMVFNHGYPSYQGFLNDKCVTIAEVLKPAGYHTAMAGKWHVGEDRPHWPIIITWSNAMMERNATTRISGNLPCSGSGHGPTFKPSYF